MKGYKDPDTKWLKKGKKYYFGYKNFANVDEEGFYDNIHTEPANSAEVNKTLGVKALI